jgi:hypothetical protein
MGAFLKDRIDFIVLNRTLLIDERKEMLGLLGDF